MKKKTIYQAYIIDHDGTKIVIFSTESAGAFNLISYRLQDVYPDLKCERI